MLSVQRRAANSAHGSERPAEEGSHWGDQRANAERRDTAGRHAYRSGVVGHSVLCRHVRRIDVTVSPGGAG